MLHCMYGDLFRCKMHAYIKRNQTNWDKRHTENATNICSKLVLLGIRRKGIKNPHTVLALTFAIDIDGMEKRQNVQQSTLSSIFGSKSTQSHWKDAKHKNDRTKRNRAITKAAEENALHFMYYILICDFYSLGEPWAKNWMRKPDPEPIVPVSRVGHFNRSTAPKY